MINHTVYFEKWDYFFFFYDCYNYENYSTGPFVKEGPSSPAASPLLRRSQVTPRAVQRTGPDTTDGTVNTETTTTAPAAATQQQSGKVIIRAAKSPERAPSPDYVRTPATVVAPTAPATANSQQQQQQQRQLRQGAYVNVQGDGEGKTTNRRSISSPRKQLNGINGSIKSKPKITSPLTNGNKVDNKTRDEVKSSESRVATTNAENKPPRARHPTALRFKPKFNNSLERKVLKSNSRFDKTNLYPQSLKPSGNTPKLIRRLPIGSESKTKNTEETLDKENKETLLNGVTSSNGKIPEILSESLPDRISTESPKVEHKLKRSESYRMANSPIMFIKKLSSANSSASTSEKKIFRTASEELREDLLKERINYPESVASPEPDIVLDSTASIVEEDVLGGSFTSNKMPFTPRPRATDLEPARVLKYTGTETEIW